MSEKIRRSVQAARSFFNDMSSTYDEDLVELGWSPVELVKEWPFMVLPGEKYLDVGCGTGALLSFFSGAQRQLSAMELSPHMIAKARKRPELKQVEFVNESAGNPWPFPSDSFDKVTCLAMLEFVENLDEAFDEMLRVLKPGGRALFSVEDRVDWSGNDRGTYENRYGELHMWQRDLETIELCLPPGAKVVRTGRVRGYEVLELGFVTAYHILEVEKEYR